MVSGQEDCQVLNITRIEETKTPAAKKAGIPKSTDPAPAQ